MHESNTSIEPSRLSLPAMDRPSVAFAWFLDSMIVATDANGATPPTETWLECSLCGFHVCDIEDTINLRVLLNTALAHTC